MLLLLLLSGCGEGAPPETRILVSIQEGDGFTVENNGQYIQPGEDVVFLLKVDYGYTLAAADYAGEYRTAVDGGQIKLTLKNVQYPTRMALHLTNSFCTITYDPNGGEGEAATITHNTLVRLRPNTLIGTDIFSREGYTLTGWNTCADGAGSAWAWAAGSAHLPKN